MNSKLSTKPLLTTRSPKPAKILEPEDTPVHLQSLMDLAREAGQKFGEECWNLMIHMLHEKLGKRAINGNDALSLMTTSVTYYMATWLVMMKRMAYNDEAGVEVEEMITSIIEGAQKLIKSANIAGISK